MELSEESARTRQLLQAAGVGLWDWNLITDEVYFSPEWLRQLGYAEGELRGHPDSWADRLHPDDKAVALAAAEDFGRGTRDKYDEEFRMRHRDGDYRWILAQASMVHDESGRRVRMIGSHVDITRRKEAEAALLASEERFTRALDATRDGIWDWSIPHGTVYFSPQWARLLGYEPEEVPTRVEFFFEVVHPDDRARIKQVLDDHLAGLTEAKQDEVRLQTKTGAYRWFLDRGKVVARDAQGNPVRMVGTITDITERKLAETERVRLEAQLRQAQKLESVGRLAGGVAHDFNNMLGVILGHAELALRHADPSAPAYADLVGIRDAATRSAEITRQLLAFARQQSVVPEIVGLDERVRGMLTMLSRLLGEDIAVHYTADNDIWPVRIDPSQVDQILTNLCVNARNAITDVGTLTIHVGNTELDAAYCERRVDCVPGEYVRLSVRDSGAGMDAVTLAHIFEPFFTTDTSGESSGLGLATVFGAVTQNEGHINVVSSPGAGTTFDIYLPRHEGEPSEERVTSGEHQAVTEQCTILVVEDEPALLRIAVKILEAQGYEVLPAAGPEEALSIAQSYQGTIDLLLTDVIMPRMNGRALAAQLESIRPALRFVFMSGYPADVIATHGVLDEEFAFLHKPFRISELIAAIRAALAARPTRSVPRDAAGAVPREANTHTA